MKKKNEGLILNELIELWAKNTFSMTTMFFFYLNECVSMCVQFKFIKILDIIVYKMSYLCLQFCSIEVHFFQGP